MRAPRAKVVSVLALGLLACVAEQRPARERGGSGGGAPVQEPDTSAMGQTGRSPLALTCGE